jgi:rhodanese-related sulfurtransferase
MRPRVPFARIDVDQARALIARDNLLILDVRAVDAFNAARIPMARNFSVSDINDLMVFPRDTPILIYCYRGFASQEYGQYLSDFGFTAVYSLDGGYEAWSQTGKTAGDRLTDRLLQHWLAGNGFAADSISATGDRATTPLMQAAHHGEPDIVARLVRAGAPLNARNADGNNALWLACVGGNIDVVNTLIDAGIDLDNRNDNGASALMYASSAGKPAIVATLLERGADPTLETLDGFSALDMAANIDCLTLLRRQRVLQH